MGDYMFLAEKEFIVHRRRQGLRIVRGLAVLLCLILCLESVPRTVLAAESGMGSLSENTAEEGEEQKSPAEEGEEPKPSVGEGEGEEQKPSVEEGEEQKPPVEEGEEQKPSVEDGGDQETPAEDEEGQEQVSGNDADSVSENDLSTISENDPESVSDNSLDAEREAMIQRAQEAFDALISDKSLLAVLYHANSYDARSKAAADGQAAATLEIGQTLYMQGVEITEDDVWYRTQYFINGAEGTGYVQSYYLAYADEDWLAWEEEYLLPILQSGKEIYENTAYGMRSYSMMTYAVDTSDISAFPGSYQAALRSLKNAHPNWTFVPMKTGLDFNTSVSQEMGAKSLIQKTTDNKRLGRRSLSQ